MRKLWLLPAAAIASIGLAFATGVTPAFAAPAGIWYYVHKVSGYNYAEYYNSTTGEMFSKLVAPPQCAGGCTEVNFTTSNVDNGATLLIVDVNTGDCWNAPGSAVVEGLCNFKDPSEAWWVIGAENPGGTGGQMFENYETGDCAEVAGDQNTDNSLALTLGPCNSGYDQVWIAGN